jgi:Na+-transporting methylmalonyl-CoA/oxaloacetate decarboxylase gamma subunit
MTTKGPWEGTAWMLWVMMVAILFMLLFILVVWMWGTLEMPRARMGHVPLRGISQEP